MSLTPSGSQRILFHPSRSSRHRIACLGLYRALVRQALLVPLEQQPTTARRNPIHELIRRQFRRNEDDVSKRLVFSALAAGYKFLTLLDRAKDTTSSEYRSIMTLLDQRRKEAETSHLHDRRVKPTPLSPSSSSDSDSSPAADPHTVPNPVIKLVQPASLLRPPVYARAQPMRPTNLLKSRRHIPVLVITAAGVPFLRFGKPQPSWLSHMLQHRTGRREKWADCILSLKEEITETAENEDMWDILVGYMRKRYLGKEMEDGEEKVKEADRGTYMDSVLIATKEVEEAWSEDTLDLAAQAKAMLEIVEEERRARDEEDKKGWFYPPKDGEEPPIDEPPIWRPSST